MTRELSESTLLAMALKVLKDLRPAAEVTLDKNKPYQMGQVDFNVARDVLSVLNIVDAQAKGKNANT